MKTLALVMLATVMALLALVSLSEHRAEQRALPLVRTAAPQAPMLFSPCPPQRQNFAPMRDRKA